VSSQCDEARPECVRCTRAGRECPGYRPLNDLVFKPMNSDIPEHRDRRKKRKATASTKVSVPTPVYVPPNWEDAAMGYFLHHHVLPGDHLMSGHFEWLPEMIGRPSNPAHLTNVLKAVSFSSLGNITSITYLTSHAHQYYITALHQVSAALSDPVQAKSDELLTTICLLQKYEVISGSKSIVGNTVHDKGMLELVRQRGPEQLKTQVGRALFRMVVSKIHLTDLACELTDGQFTSFPKLELPSTSASDLMQLMFKTARGTTAVKRVISKIQAHNLSHKNNDYEPDQSLVQALFNALKAVHQTDQALESWKQTAPQPKQIPVHSGPSDANQYPRVLLAYSEIRECRFWGAYWSCRIRSIQALIDGRNAIQSLHDDCISRIAAEITIGMNFDNEIHTENGSHPASYSDSDYTDLSIPYMDQLAQLTELADELPSISWLHSQLQQCADSICSSVSFMLSEIDSNGNPTFACPPAFASANTKDTRGRALGAFLLAAMLFVAVNSVKVIPELQRVWMIQQLQKIGHVFGIRHALSIAKWVDDKRERDSFAEDKPQGRL
jgi:hypothetical protein